MRRKNITSEMMMDYIAQALLLLMREKTYGDITIGEITKKAGVNRSTYYRHFETKESIIVFYLDSIMKEYLDAFHGKGSSDFSEYLLTMFGTFYKHKDDLVLLHKEKLTIYLLDVLNIRFGFGEIKKDAEPSKQFSASYHIGGIFNNLLLWFEHGLKETPADMTKIALSYKPQTSFSLFNI